MIPLGLLEAFSAFLYGDFSEAPPVRPVSQADAIAEFTSREYADFDRFGQPRFLPSSSTFEEVPPWVFPEGQFVPHRHQLASTSVSTVFELESPNTCFVVKYHGFCKNLDEPVDATLRESYFGELINGLSPGLVPRVMYFSAAVPGARMGEASPKLPTGMDLKCGHSGIDRVVRFMVMERVGLDLYDLVDIRGKVGFFDAIRLGIETFQNLEKLHDIDIQHGDIHAGNIAFRDIGLDLATASLAVQPLVLIDFGRAKIGLEDADQTDYGDFVYCSGLLSPWESRIHTPSYRDDVFRVMLVLAVMIHGKNHPNVQEMICGPNREPDRVAQYMRLKLEVIFFDWEVILPVGKTNTIKYTFSLSEVLATGGVSKPSSVDSIRGILGTLLNDIRAMSFDARANFIGIIHQLQQILALEPIIVL
jgi:serine/threonine protein kinase